MSEPDEEEEEEERGELVDTVIGNLDDWQEDNRTFRDAEQ